MQENKSKFNLINLASVFFIILFLVLAFYIYSNKKNTIENKNIETSKIINTKEEQEVSETKESSKVTSSISENSISKTVKIKADVWADNWFAFYVGDMLIKEDSVSINTEKSFNKESFIFEATYPLQFNFVVKDYKANDTGLEYIGTERQQMGDGGLIAQFTNAETGELIAVTDSNWKSKVIHSAPLDTACEKSKNPIVGTVPCTYKIITEPSDWKSANFDDSLWSNASTFSSTEVGPKGGYDEISWDKKAKFIWGPDLHKDNTILMRLKLEDRTSVNTQSQKVFSLSSPEVLEGGNLPKDYTCDGTGSTLPLSWNNVPASTKSFAIIMSHIPNEKETAHWYLELYNIPSNVSSISKNNTNIGTNGGNSVNKNMAYAPPCSKGPGSKKYTYTVYALSDMLSISGSITRDNLLSAMKNITLKSSELNVIYSR